MNIRDELVALALRWEKELGVFSGQAGLTASVSEYDAAMMLGYSEADYAASVRGRTSVSRGYDFIFNGKKIQVKGNRIVGVVEVIRLHCTGDSNAPPLPGPLPQGERG